MNRDIFEGSWKQIRGRVQEWWGHLTDDELDKIEGKRDRLVGLVQKKYGYTKAQAEAELEHYLSEYERYAGTSASHSSIEENGYTTPHQRRRQDEYVGQTGVSEPSYGAHASTLTHPRVMAVGSLIGTLTGYRVINPAGDDLGKIEDIVIDMESGRIAYAVLSFGGFLGIGDKYFAIPWEALRMSTAEEAFILHVDREALANAPGFDTDHWPEMADRQWGAGIYSYYGYRPYWEE